MWASKTGYWAAAGRGPPTRSSATANETSEPRAVIVGILAESAGATSQARPKGATAPSEAGGALPRGSEPPRNRCAGKAGARTPVDSPFSDTLLARGRSRQAADHATRAGRHTRHGRLPTLRASPSAAKTARVPPGTRPPAAAPRPATLPALPRA